MILERRMEKEGGREKLRMNWEVGRDNGKGRVNEKWWNWICKMGGKKGKMGED